MYVQDWTFEFHIYVGNQMLNKKIFEVPNYLN